MKDKISIRNLLFLIALFIISVFSVFILRTHSIDQSGAFLFGAVKSFFQWWNDLDPTIRFLLILSAAVSIGVLTGFAVVGGGLLFGIFTGFSNFASFSSMLTSAFSKTKIGQKLHEKYGVKYDRAIMWINWALSVLAVIGGGIAAINAERTIDSVLPIALIGFATPDLILQSNVLQNMRKGDYAPLKKYLNNHSNDDKAGLALIITSLLLLTPSSVLRILHKSDSTQLEQLVEKTGSKLSDPNFYERIKSFYEIVNNLKEISDDPKEEAIYSNLKTAYDGIDLSNPAFSRELYDSEINFIVHAYVSSFWKLETNKGKTEIWSGIESLWKQKYQLFQHVKQTLDDNSSFNNQSIFFNFRINGPEQNNIRASLAFLELLNNVPKESYAIDGYNILYNQFNHNLLVQKNNNIIDLINIEPQFLTFLRYNKNRDNIKLPKINNKIDYLNNSESKVVSETELLNLLFEIELVQNSNSNKNLDMVKRKFQAYLQNHEMSENIRKALTSTNFAFQEFLESFDLSSTNKDYCFRQLTSKSNSIGLKRMDYYLLLEKSFSEMYIKLFNIQDLTSDELIKSCKENIQTYNNIKKFQRSLDCKTLIPIPYYFR